MFFSGGQCCSLIYGFMLNHLCMMFLSGLKSVVELTKNEELLPVF